MNNKVKIVLTVIVLSCAIFLGYKYIAYGRARDIQSEKTEFRLTTNEIKNEFQTNPDESTKKYQNKTIELLGIISSKSDSIITLDESVFCKMNTLNTAIKVNQKVNIKGRLIGFDDLLGDVKLDECTVIK